jgi:hypothetical protein
MLEIFWVEAINADDDYWALRKAVASPVQAYLGLRICFDLLDDNFPKDVILKLKEDFYHILSASL